jgi:hypothetical protein
MRIRCRIAGTPTLRYLAAPSVRPGYVVCYSTTSANGQTHHRRISCRTSSKSAVCSDLVIFRLSRSAVAADNNSHCYIPELLRVRSLNSSTMMKRLLVSLFNDRFRPRSRHRRQALSPQQRARLGKAWAEHSESALPRAVDIRADLEEVRVGPQAVNRSPGRHKRARGSFGQPRFAETLDDQLRV